MASGEQGFQQIVIPKGRIDPEVIAGVIFVVAACQEYRVEVERADPQILQIAQFEQDALQIPAKEIFGRGQVSPCTYVRRVVVWIAVVEPVREDLVENRIGHPGRDVPCLDHPARWVCRLAWRSASAKIKYMA